MGKVIEFPKQDPQEFYLACGGCGFTEYFITPDGVFCGDCEMEVDMDNLPKPPKE